MAIIFNDNLGNAFKVLSIAQNLIAITSKFIKEVSLTIV